MVKIVNAYKILAAQTMRLFKLFICLTAKYMFRLYTFLGVYYISVYRVNFSSISRINWKID